MPDQVLAVSSVVKDVAIPLLAAAIAALGIVLPLALVARNERIKLGLQRDIERDQLKQQREAENEELQRRREQERLDQIARAVQATRRDALLLRELITTLALKSKTGDGTPTAQEIATLQSARERLFKGLHENAELFATLVPNELQSGRRLEKLMLLLGMLESRLRSFEETYRLDGVTLFGLDFLIHSVDPESLHADTKLALKRIADSDPEAAAFFKELLQDAP